MKAVEVAHHKYKGRRYNSEVDFFDFVKFEADLRSFIARYKPNITHREIALACDLSTPTVKDALQGRSLGLKAACRLAVFADLSLDKYVKGL